MKIDPKSLWAKTIYANLKIPENQIQRSSAQKTTESVAGGNIGTFKDETPAKWGKPKNIKKLRLASGEFEVAEYHQGVKALFMDDEIQMIVVGSDFEDKSSRGVKIGSKMAEIRTEYGAPSRVVATTQGAAWVYESQGISFRLRDGKVVSWQVF